MNITIEWDGFVENIAGYTGVTTDKITKETSIYNDLGMDSLGLFSLGMYLIKTYGVKIPISSVARIESVNDIYNLLIEEGVSNN